MSDATDPAPDPVAHFSDPDLMHAMAESPGQPQGSSQWDSYLPANDGGSSTRRVFANLNVRRVVLTTVLTLVVVLAASIAILVIR